MEAGELCWPSEAVVKADTTIVACGRYRPVRIQDFLRFEWPLSGLYSNGMDSFSPDRHSGATLVNDINQSTEKRSPHHCVGLQFQPIGATHSLNFSASE